MITEIKVPSPGESITEVQISRWLKKNGDYVEKDEEIAEIDSDKATLTLSAEADGVLKILAKEGETVKVGSTVCTIDDAGKKPEASNKKQEGKITATQSQPVKTELQTKISYAENEPSPAAKKIMAEKNLSSEKIPASGKGGRITKADVLSSINKEADQPKTVQKAAVSADGEKQTSARGERREKMSMLRKRLAQRLVAVKNQTAMLTTFNEVDMSAVMEIRKKYKDVFKEKHGVGLGFMSFFTKAVTGALKTFPALNAYIDGEELIYHDYCDIGIAVSAPRGLMVPIIRNAETLSLAEIEMQVADLAVKARDGKITIEEMTGGTFTISNGGVFGSLMSTPILNPPQSAILGMHNIVDRPVAVNGKIEIRPMMYLALSYDHRIIDGKESVSFLVHIKKSIEDPVNMLFDGADPVKKLLGL